MIWLALSIGLATVIAVLSLLRSGAWIVRVTPQPLQKLLHVGFYAALIVTLLNVRAPSGTHEHVWVWACATGAIGIGGTLEWLQSFRPGRFARIADVVLDVIGVLLGIGIWHVWKL